MTLALMSKAFSLNNTTPTNNNQRSVSNPSNMQNAQPGMNMDQDRQMLMVEDNVGHLFRPNVVQNIENQVVQNAVQNLSVQIIENMNWLSVVLEIANQYRNRNVVSTPAEGNGSGINGNPIRCYTCRGEVHYASNCTVKPMKRDVVYLQQLLQMAQEEEAGIQSTQEEFEFMAADAYEETERVKANYILKNNLQQASTSGTQSDKAPVYDSDGSAEGEYNNMIPHACTLVLPRLRRGNNDPSSSPLPPKELNVEEIKTVKSSIDEPPELELKELPSHLEYTFLEGTDKLPVIISKELKDEENSALLKVLKSHKRAITWKISDIKGIDPRLCTHKILMEDDFKPMVQHQRRVNPKIHEVIKKEVIKLFDAGIIYPISDSPWVSPVHCVPKKGGMTVIKNEDNELIPTRLVTGWRVCIDYRKLNDATRKDHFSLPFMDQML
nr:reverse transcriptase domain-containing protein [Tanacetum cinerariifolium]